MKPVGKRIRASGVDEIGPLDLDPVYPAPVCPAPSETECHADAVRVLRIPSTGAIE